MCLGLQPGGAHLDLRLEGLRPELLLREPGHLLQVRRQAARLRKHRHLSVKFNISPMRIRRFCGSYLRIGVAVARHVMERPT